MDGIMQWFERLFDGSLVAGGIFLIIGIVGGVLLLISLVLDGIFDAFDFGDGPLSLTTIAAFTSIFGFASFACVGAGMSTPLAAVVGALAGLVGGAAAFWLSKLIRGAESSTAVSSGDLVGVTGAVVLQIPEGGLGEVAVIRNGERISLSATADSAIPRGAAVRITHTVTSTSVRVAPVEASPAPHNDEVE
ncbi:hypothetical protein JD292_09580 [Leucobacter sp. CSA2]|uniref:NfeD-like C-terminal domain-containing protein n=1 Tax=Leucobacter edaphi TaxID=2796472 RepID=A0A934QDP9_9MICO|nr:hypothetical protein [Leucobacter edaphi]MBK0422323.1 hypothetical protein [Leucobacter edaphi]